MFSTDASVHRDLFAMSARCCMRIRWIYSSLCFLSILLKSCLFIQELLFLCRTHLICDPTDILCSFLNLSLWLFLRNALAVLLGIKILFAPFSVNLFFLVVFCFGYYHCAVVAVAASSFYSSL